MATAIGATAPQATGFVATVQAAYNGSKVQWAVNGIFSVLGTVLSTLVTHKFKTLGVVSLVAGAYVYRAEIKTFGRGLWIQMWGDSASGAAASANGGGAAATASAAGGGGDSKDVKNPK